MIHILFEKGHQAIDKLRKKIGCPDDVRYEGKLVKVKTKTKKHHNGRITTFNIKIGK